jgi:hypothetical protein
VAVGRYSAIIDLGVIGSRQVEEILNKTASLRDILKSINKTPIAIDDRRAGDVFRRLAKSVNDFTRDVANGNKQLANTEIGLKKQADALSRVAAQSKIGQAVYTNAIEAQVKAEQKLRLAQLERVNTEQKLFARGKTAFSESFKGIPELLAFEPKIKNTTAALNLYKNELARTLDVVEIGSNEFRALEEALAKVEQRLSAARLSGQTSAIRPAAGPSTQLGSLAAFRQRERFEKQLEQQLIRQLSIEERINQANLDENQKQELRNRLGEATNQLAAKELTIAKQLTSEVERQRISLERRVTGGTRRTGDFTPLTAPSRAKNIRQSALLIQEKINTLQARGVDITEAKARIESVLLNTEEDKLDLSLKSLNTLDDELNSVRQLLRLEQQRLATKRAQTGADTRVAGKKQDPFTRTPLGRAAVGAAFPALFGAGPGGIIGGGLGELAGPLGGVIGSAIGGIFDRFIQGQSQIATSLQETNDVFSALESAGFKVAGSLKSVVSELESTGQASAAFRIKQNELQKAYGANAVRDLANYDRANQRLADSIKRITSGVLPPILRVLTAISDIGAGAVNLFVDGVEAVRDLFRFVAGTQGADGDRARPDFRLEGGFAQASAADKEAARIAATTLPGEEARNLFKNSTFFQRYKKENEELRKQQAIVDSINRSQEQASKKRSDVLKRELNLKKLQLKVAQDAQRISIEATIRENALLREQLQLRLTNVERIRQAENSITNLNQLMFSIAEREQEMFGTQIPEVVLGKRDAANAETISRQVAEFSANLILARKNGENLFTNPQIQAYADRFRDLLRLSSLLNDQEKKRQRLLEEINKELEVRQTIESYVQPLRDIREEHELSLATQKEYNRLLLEGVLPSEAKRITEFNKQVEVQLRQIDAALILAEAEAARLKGNELLTKEYERQLELINNLKKARGAVETEAAKGPGEGRTSDRAIIEDRVAKLQGELTEMTKLGNISIQVADNIGAAFSTAFQDVVNGSKSTQEALSDMFKTIGESFVQMAAEIIAKQLIMITLQAILKALGGAVGGGGGSPLSIGSPSEFGGGNLFDGSLTSGLGGFPC